MTDESDDRVGHLNTLLARRSGNLKDPFFKKVLMPGLCRGGGGGGGVEVSS